MATRSKASGLAHGFIIWLLLSTTPMLIASAHAQQKQPSIVMLMTDDTGWNDFGAYSGGGAALGHPTPHVDQITKGGATFTNWDGQAICAADRSPSRSKI